MTNDVFEEAGKHYVTLFVRCEMEDPKAQPEVRSSTRKLCEVRAMLTLPRFLNPRSVMVGTG